MKNWTLVDEAAIPGSDRFLRLFKGKDDFTIRISSITAELMSTRKHGSEDALGELSCEHLKQTKSAGS
jgi:hypothetical protein